jgi:hypothetical protein
VDLLIKCIHCIVTMLIAVVHAYLGSAQDMIPIENETVDGTGMKLSACMKTMWKAFILLQKTFKGWTSFSLTYPTLTRPA